MATKTLQPDPDEMLKQLAAQAATQGENLRMVVRELTLHALLDGFFAAVLQREVGSS